MRTRETPRDHSLTFMIVCVLILIAGVVTQCRYMRTSDQTLLILSRNTAPFHQERQNDGRGEKWLSQSVQDDENAAA